MPCLCVSVAVFLKDGVLFVVACLASLCRWLCRGRAAFGDIQSAANETMKWLIFSTVVAIALSRVKQLEHH